MTRENTLVGALAGMATGIVLHGIWLFFLLQIWPPRFLKWPSHTNALHTTILTVPYLGWDVEPVTAGLVGIIGPLLLSLGGMVLGRMATTYWLTRPGVLRAMGAFCGLLVAVNAVLLFQLLCVED